MIYNNYICYDFETGGLNPRKCQITQLAAVIIDFRTLEIIDGAHFNSEVCPEFDDEKAIAMGFDPVAQEALDKTHKTREQLLKAPKLEQVWPTFVDFVNRYRVGKGRSSWDAPIPVGYNIENFDSKIIERLCEKHGPWDSKWYSQNLFHPSHSVDLMKDFLRWTENDKSITSLSLDNIRAYLGLEATNAHDAIKDVLDCSLIFKKFIKLYRHHSPKVLFEKSCASENAYINSMFEKLKVRY